MDEERTHCSITGCELLAKSHIKQVLTDIMGHEVYYEPFLRNLWTENNEWRRDIQHVYNYFIKGISNGHGDPREDEQLIYWSGRFANVMMKIGFVRKGTTDVEERKRLAREYRQGEMFHSVMSHMVMYLQIRERSVHMVNQYAEQRQARVAADAKIEVEKKRVEKLDVEMREAKMKADQAARGHDVIARMRAQYSEVAAAIEELKSYEHIDVGDLEGQVEHRKRQRAEVEEETTRIMEETRAISNNVRKIKPRVARVQELLEKTSALQAEIADLEAGVEDADAQAAANAAKTSEVAAEAARVGLLLANLTKSSEYLRQDIADLQAKRSAMARDAGGVKHLHDADITAVEERTRIVQAEQKELESRLLREDQAHQLQLRDLREAVSQIGPRVEAFVKSAFDAMGR